MSDLLILHYTEDTEFWSTISSTATKESLTELLNELGFVIVDLANDLIDDGPGLWRFTVTRSDLDGPREVTLNADGKILYIEYGNSVEYYAEFLRWMRGHLPNELALSVVSGSGSPFFVVDFDQLDEQIREEIPLS